MKLELNNKLLWGVLAITFASVALSMVLTIPVLYFTSADAESTVIAMKQGIPLSILIPPLIAIPLSYFVLLQRQKIETINNKLVHLLKYDALTMLLSRRGFFQEAEMCLENISDGNRSNAVLFVDLDNFKQINDGFGHETGDKILRSFGVLMNGFLESNEFAGRIGGEEFCIFIQNCTPAHATSRAEALVEQFRQRTRLFDGKKIGGTLSVGVAVSAETRNVDDLIREADCQLYKAKQNGRNCVAIDDPLQKAA